jgi:hypothetical protein
MEMRKLMGFVVAVIAGLGGTVSSDAEAALVSLNCTVTSVGWRDNIKALRTTANAALLSGTQVQMYYDTQGGCNTTDLVIRELYLLN